MPRREAQRRESDIQREVLIALSAAGCMVWRSNTGLAYPISEMKQSKRPPRAVMVGVPGQPDILGVATGGRGLAVECKRERGRQSPQQRLFQAAWEKAGGMYILARSVEDALKGLGRADILETSHG